MDYALAVSLLLPDADFRRADDYAALVATWHDARPIPTDAALIAAYEAHQAQAGQAEAVAALAAGLLAIFMQMTPAQRGRNYPARAGIKLALEEGDVTAAKEVVKSISALDEDEEAIKQSMLDLFPT